MARYKKSKAELAREREFKIAPAPNVEWFEEQIKRAEYDSVKDLSRAIIPTGGSGNEEKLGRALRRDAMLWPYEIVRLAEELKVPLSAIFEHLGYDRAHGFHLQEQHKVSFLGEVGSNGYIYRPRILPNPTHSPDYRLKLTAVRMATRDSILTAWHGCILFFEYRKNEIRSVSSDQLCVIRVKERSEMLLGYVKRDLAAMYVEVLGGSERIHPATLVSSAPVLWMHFP